MKVKKNVLGRVIAASLITGIALAGSQFAAAAGELPAGADRIAVLQNGHLSVKEGSLFGAWSEQAAGASAVELAGDRIGVLFTDGTAAVKVGPQGSWVNQAGGAQQIGLAAPGA